MNENEEAVGLAPTPGYRYAQRVGDQLFVAGQVPLDAQSRLVGVGDPDVQARQCLVNLSVLMEYHNFQLEDICKLVVYVVGEHANLQLAWDAVSSWFDGNVPPATLLGVHCLGYSEQLVEIDATVVRKI